jgi:hypothetical protein
MPQYPQAFVAVNPFGNVASGRLDAASNLMTSNGGSTYMANVVAPATAKSLPGRVAKVIVITPPSAGALVVNDCADPGDANASNTLLNVAFGSIADGQIFDLDVACDVGVTISSVGTGGVYAVSYS